MLDFTRATYLGIPHSSGALQPWESLTTGVPAALETPPSHEAVATDLARLVGCERGIVARSTLHLMWDLFGVWGRARPEVYVDAGIYPVSCWGVQRAERGGATVNRFRHHDVDSLFRVMRRNATRRRRPIVVTDGLCPQCGRSAPLREYLAVVRRYGGQMMIDDTQALGILGRRHNCRMAPYGEGGGGSLRWFGMSGSDIVVVNSLAKALGAPLAMLASNASLVDRVASEGETRVHSSPASAADVRAAQHALAVNARHGDALRQRLAQLVQRFRVGLRRIGLKAGGGFFPVQTLSRKSGLDARWIYQRLKPAGIRTIPLSGGSPHETQVALVINARHRLEEIDMALSAITRCADVRVTRKRSETHHAMPL